MSFHNQAFWMGNNSGSLNDGDKTYDNSSRIESKRGHQWFMDGPEVDMFPNKKQAVEAPNNLLSGMLNSNISSWGNSSSLHSFTGHFTEQLFEPDAATMNFEDANISSVSMDSTLSVERKDNLDPFGNDSSFGLSMSTTLEDPRLVFNYDGIRKVKVNEVKESESVRSVPTNTNNPYDRGVSSNVSYPHAYNGGDNSISMSQTYNKGDANIISMDDAYERTDNNLMSIGQSYNKGDDSLSIHPTYKEICNPLSMDQGFSKADSDVMSITQAYKEAHDNSMSSNHLFSKVDTGTISVGHTYHKGRNDLPLVSHSYNKGESTIISFGGCDDYDTTPSGIFISSYELLMGQAPSHKSESVNEKDLVRSTSNLLPSTAQTSAPENENVPKTKDEMKMSKKATSNNFPSNVRSLLSTGMLDGVSVKYKAWSREELRGVIKGAGYLCSCQSCNFSKVINAYEFERHAGCKTKHPNNHIYFENGKTIYGVVQELRSTPQTMLFEVIQTITGSPINQKSFRIWKESFLAAARELQRICGKDEAKQLL
ncbi:uncharacterized protein LOC133286138 isoform X2 [Gastrolobium bilobum]|uniref:uncharacterized protein LOC133286138 isoform X2 n=1 Tax=Gastrolobium bilobum TaxID=150636 RepID=UPI002AB0713A|nr:uncharacterized protein LOC133286138 isoform X2 [Gastrolobium bilobum]